MKNILKKISCFVVLLSFALQLNAHDAWVDPANGPIYAILYGHKIPEPYPVSKVTSLKVFDAKQENVPYKKIESKNGLSINTGAVRPAMFMLDFDNGFWVKIGKESKNVPHSKMPQGTDPVHPLKYSKTIMSWQNWMVKPMGQRIEFVPIGLTAMPKAGSMIKLRLLLDGKPLANQMVENNSNEMGPKTDANGMVTVTVLKGINRYATDHDIMQPNDEDAKRLSLTAAFIFIAK